MEWEVQLYTLTLRSEVLYLYEKVIHFWKDINIFIYLNSYHSF